MRGNIMWFWMALISAVLGLSWLGVERASKTSEDSEQGPTAANSASPMDRVQFWRIIERTTPLEADTEAQAAALRKELDRLTETEIEAFETTFDQIMRESYSWDLWGAAYVIHGGASDDGFEYFRVWLISKGQAVFERASADPDSLADMLAADSSGPLEFEEFAYIAREAWAAKTGKDYESMPIVAAMIYPDLEPSGEPFEEDEAHLAKRYPKLWKRFSDSPAQ